ncbi:MAG TPA: hypothetical protein H9986_05905 [Candidatus Prevotella stercoripullorum]|nr:hypothetical protein [Candidatus Prevotella stercoripullorum]
MGHVKPYIIRLATAAVLGLLAYTIGIFSTSLAIILITCIYLPVRFTHYGKEGRKSAIILYWTGFVLGTAWLIVCAAAFIYYLYYYIFLTPTDKDGYRDLAPLLTLAIILLTCTILRGRDFMAKRWMERHLEVWQKRTFVDFNKADGNYYAIEQFGDTFLKYTLLAGENKFIITSYEIWLQPDCPDEEAKTRTAQITAEVERLGINVKCELRHIPTSVFANVSLTLDKRDVNRRLLDRIAHVFIEDAENDYDKPYYIRCTNKGTTYLVEFRQSRFVRGIMADKSKIELTIDEDYYNDDISGEFEYWLDCWPQWNEGKFSVVGKDDFQTEFTSQQASAGRGAQR